MSWPDHGVPDDCSDFLDFVNEVRQSRSGVVESTIVHCRSVMSWFALLLSVAAAVVVVVVFFVLIFIHYC